MTFEGTSITFGDLEASGGAFAYTLRMLSKRGEAEFLYRDSLWHGADLLGVGVASFSHLGGVHAQNEHDLGPYAGEAWPENLKTIAAMIRRGGTQALR